MGSKCTRQKLLVKDIAAAVTLAEDGESRKINGLAWRRGAGRLSERVTEGAGVGPVGREGVGDAESAGVTEGTRGARAPVISWQPRITPQRLRPRQPPQRKCQLRP